MQFMPSVGPGIPVTPLSCILRERFAGGERRNLVTAAVHEEERELPSVRLLLQHLAIPKTIESKAS